MRGNTPKKNQGNAKTGGGYLICDWSSAPTSINEEIADSVASTLHTRVVPSGDSSLFDIWD